MLCDSCMRRRYSLPLQQLHSWSLASDLGRPSARAAVKATSTSSVCPVSLSIHHCVNAFSCVLFSFVGANGFPHCRNFIKPIVYILLKTTKRRQLKRMPLIKSTGRTVFCCLYSRSFACHGWWVSTQNQPQTTDGCALANRIIGQIMYL